MSVLKSNKIIFFLTKKNMLENNIDIRTLSEIIFVGKFC